MVVTAQTDIDSALEAALCVTKTHFALADYLKAGQTMAEIDAHVEHVLSSLDCRSAFLRYKIPGHPPFPSHACLSLNDCIVHGTHDLTDTPLKPGDIFSIDIGVMHKGWVGDAAWTYAIEHASDEALRLMECGKESLRRGLATIKPGRPLMDWARAVHH